MKTPETKKERESRKAQHMAQLSRHGKGMETAEDIADWDKKFEDANPLPEENCPTPFPNSWEEYLWKNTYKLFVTDSTGKIDRASWDNGIIKIISKLLEEARKEGEEIEKKRFASDYLFLNFIDPYVNKKVQEERQRIVEIIEKTVDSFPLQTWAGEAEVYEQIEVLKQRLIANLKTNE